MFSPVINALKYNIEEIHKRRKMRVFCVGCIKTGTHYIADIFAKNYRSFHEPHVRFYQAMIAQDRKQLLKLFMRVADPAYRLDVNSSHLNRYMIPLILDLYPNSSFLLNYRQCRSWLDSIMNHMIFLPLEVYWKDWAILEFGVPPYDYPSEERLLQDRQIPPLAILLGYWERHNRFVLDHVPSSQLLVIELSDLFKSKNLLAEFLEIDPDSITDKREKSFSASGRANLLEEIAASYVDGRIEEICAPVLARLEAARAIPRLVPS